MEEVLYRFTVSVRLPRRDRWPLFKTIGYTLNISARFLAAQAVGKGTVARADELIAWYWRKIMQAGLVTLIARDRHHVVPGQPHVVMSNHTSLLDIPTLMGAVPGSLRMVTKEELCRIPIWGHALVASGFIPITRNNREKAVAQLEKAKEVLRKGVNVWVAPEGTRSRTGELLPFKKGGFHTAVSLGVPIVPTWIEGTKDIIAPDQFAVNYGATIRVRFGQPISTEGCTDIQPLMEQVRHAMLALSGTGTRDECATNGPQDAQPGA